MGRSPCCHDDNLKKGPWMPEEDERLVNYIKEHGHGSWRALPKHAGLNRCGKSCRLRWMNYLRPDIKRGKFSEDEELLIINLHGVLGNKWSTIANHLPGRTDNEIKNFWNTHIRKKLFHMGIDPNTHKPRTDVNLLLTNLLSLISVTNICNLISPWNSNFLKLQADANHPANFQVLQNLLLHPNSRSHHFEAYDNNDPLGGLANETNNSWAYNRGGFISEQTVHSHMQKNLAEIQVEYPLSGLVSDSPDISTFYQMESQSKMYSTHVSDTSPNLTLYETWEEIMGDEDYSFWKDVFS